MTKNKFTNMDTHTVHFQWNKRPSEVRAAAAKGADKYPASEEELLEFWEARYFRPPSCSRAKKNLHKLMQATNSY